MIIYKDIVSRDEMISDAFDMTLTHEGAVYEVDCKTITIMKGADVNIGANASAEDAPEALEDGQETVNNVIHSFRLVQTNFEKKDYFKYLKGYMGRVKKYLSENGAPAEEIAKFENGATAFAKAELGLGIKGASGDEAFGKWEFYIGESMEVEGMVALLNYRPDGETPYMVFWKHGLKEEKV
ncbi:translationally controlled tumor-associated [Choiromyces venosus 120613-1]|uniref:Translationally-controlled tumor protein homolog n=1 Tax=Choiromyces venosus 120613-1 TaxID=1336337 RepID=A0A3N4JYN7_9PEZI|nr:translationally controlled tumor-associated [Choiromyces venosus 120613-1]